MLRLQKYDLSVIKYVKGNYLHVAEQFIYLRNTTCRYSCNYDPRYSIATVNTTNWPVNLCNVPEILRQYWKVKEDLCAIDNLLLKGDHIVIRTIQQARVGIESHPWRSSWDRKLQSWSYVEYVYIGPTWMMILKEWFNSVQCATNTLEEIKRSKLHPHSIPMLLLHKVGADYFTVANQSYLLVVDFFSKYPKVIPVQGT